MRRGGVAAWRPGSPVDNGGQAREVAEPSAGSDEVPSPDLDEAHPRAQQHHRDPLLRIKHRAGPADGAAPRRTRGKSSPVRQIAESSTFAKLFTSSPDVIVPASGLLEFWHDQSLIG